MKRLLSLLLALCMAAAWLPAGALAAENTGMEMPQALSGFRVNPLYEGAITEGAGDWQYGAMPASDVTYYANPASAGQEIRAFIEKRDVTFTVGYQIPYEDYTNEGLYTIAVDILDAAFAHTGVPTQGDYLKWQYGRSDFSAMAYSHNDEGTAYNCVITFVMTYYTDAAQEAAVTQRVEELLLQLNPAGTDYEKLTTVYDWICDNVRYDYDHVNNVDYLTQFTAYGAMIDGTAVCQGFALLLYRMALEMGIDCRLIGGIGINNEGVGGHAWNIVKLGDKYYNTDATWDVNYAANDDYAYYLISEANFGVDHIRDDEYAAGGFNDAYPMGDTDYNPDADTGSAYPVTGTCGEGLTWSLTEDGTLTISGRGDMTDFEYPNTPWYAYRESIAAVEIQEGITSIGDCAFAECAEITSIVIPGGVTEIGRGAFYFCEGLQQVSLPDGLLVIGDDAFYSCTGLSKINLPDSLTTVGSWAFSCCKSLNSIELPNSVTAIGDSAFFECVNLKSATLPLGITAIEAQTFVGCSGLVSIVIPGGVESIGENAFGYCTSLTDVVFAGDAPAIGQDAFCEVTAAVRYPAANASWTSDVMQNYGGTLTWAAYGDILTGDLNGNGAVDDGDVAQLLWYTLFPENYAIVGNADFNADGRIDDADVAYLLWHTLFPDAYPLN